jgi:hypothetical protein
LLEKLYVSYKAGTIQRNHIFKVEDTDKSLNTQCSKHDGAYYVLQPMLKRGRVLEKARTDKINDFMLETLMPPGLRPIKQ